DLSRDYLRAAIKDVLGETLAKTETKTANGKIVMGEMAVSPSGSDTIASILGALKKSEDYATVQQMSLDVDPHKDAYNFSSLYKRRNNLVPPVVLKRLRDT